MPPKTKAGTVKPLLGQPDSVLHPEFIVVAKDGNPPEDILPFFQPLNLPCICQVVKLYFFYRELDCSNQFVSMDDICSRVAGHVVKYWTMAGLQTVVLPNVKIHVKKAVEEYKSINKNRSRTSQTEVNKREAYLDKIKKLFDIATPGLEDILKKNRLLKNDDDCPDYRIEEGYTRSCEDINFLIDQRGERKMTMGSRDQSYEERVNKSDQNKQKLKEMEEETRKAQIVTKKPPQNAVEDGESDIDDQEDKDFTPVQGRYRKKGNVLIELPRDILNSPDVCAMLDRTGTTSRKAAGVVSSILKCGKIDGKTVDLSEFTLSRPTLERKRAHNRSVNMEMVMDEFQRNMPKRSNLHWDGKLMKDAAGILQEMEAILVSGAPHYLEGKILCVSKLVNEDGEPTSTGEAQAAAVLLQIREWGVDQYIVAFVFDTTASNTGKYRGATVRLLKELDRPIFFLGCRHHVSELIVKASWYCLFEADLSPDCQFFSEIKATWSSIDTSSEAEIIILDKELEGREEALIFLRELLGRKNRRNEMTVRDDYRELAECAMILLGETPPSGKISWKKPGACHKARFCAFGIYSLKALAFATQLELTADTVEALTRFCSFIATIYIPHFLASSIGCDSVVNDIQLFKKLFAYRSRDQQLAEEALVVLRRHCWYLVPEVAVFSLFSDKLCNEKKSRIASRMLTYQSSIPKTYKLEKPKFPQIDEKTEVVDLITPQSYKFFTILNLDYNWLAMDPDRWEEDESYQVAKDYVRTAKVTNDVAERGVKMAADYADILTKDDEMRKKIMQGVEKSRKMFPNFMKKTLNVQV